MRTEDVSWSNIHITNELREGLLVEVFVEHPGQTSARVTKQQEGRREKRKRERRGNREEDGNKSYSTTGQSKSGMLVRPELGHKTLNFIGQKCHVIN